eukprot:764786-Hanusia_phi.AAC.2
MASPWHREFLITIEALNCPKDPCLPERHDCYFLSCYLASNQRTPQGEEGRVEDDRRVRAEKTRLDGYDT